jgi:hypothetical protein
LAQSPQAYSTALNTARALNAAGLVQAQAQPQQVAAGYATALSGYVNEENIKSNDDVMLK